MLKYLEVLKTYAKWQLLMGLATPKLLASNDSSAFYTLLGDDVVERFNGNFEDVDKPLWLNIGYWKEARTYPDACRAMATLIGEAVDLNPADTVLDAGCGFAEQDVFFVQRFGVGRIVGIDITPQHIDVGQRRVQDMGLDDRIDLTLGSALRTGHPDGHFDKVVALESAFHFDTREDFFTEALRVLRSGGQLVLADMLPGVGQRPGGLLRRLARKRACLPSKNMYDRISYAQRLEAAGFVDVSVRSIAGYTYPGMAKYIHHRVKEHGNHDDQLEALSPDDIEDVEGLALWETSLGVTDYVIATATKP
ncbi:methyltransferase domain-containing protein [Mycolicibacterium sp. P9-64]|uniref:SAM-dependent methyltransferase n=1 Tax=Mycolicibacterium sp. P9-64 TaxID=2024612 RepID=UPI0011ED47D7|nr:class I SAM-dependent methyltransferase [Mycolicibacterium sp. P9-64]KAA0082353.1 methyltransferase domain-containing protein [Mycolicibacterium sp. P9-64]